MGKKMPEKEQKACQEFRKEQEAEFEKLLIKSGTKKSKEIKTN